MIHGYYGDRQNGLHLSSSVSFPVHWWSALAEQPIRVISLFFRLALPPLNHGQVAGKLPTRGDYYLSLFSPRKQIKLRFYNNVILPVWLFTQAIMIHNYLSQGGDVLVRLLVCWVVCQQDYTKAVERISVKPGWRMDLSPEQTPLTAGVDPIKWTDPAITLTLSDKMFSLCGSRWSKRGSLVSQWMQIEMYLNQAVNFIW